MKTINVVALVALGSISVLLLCWSGHNSVAPTSSQVGLSRSAPVERLVDGGTAVEPAGTCCLVTATDRVERSTPDRTGDSAWTKHSANCVVTN